MIIILLYLCVSLCLGFINYLVTRNLIFSIAILLIFIIFFLLYVRVKRNKYFLNLTRSFEAINYINNFIITLSVNKSLLTTYNSIKEGVSKELKAQIDCIAHLPLQSQINYLYKYFEIPIYGVFINIIEQYEYNGGDILSISQLLIQDSRNLERRLNEFKSVTKLKFNDFMITWSLSFCVLIILSYSLNNLSTSMLSIESFPILIFGFYMIFLVSLGLIINKIYDISFISKGESHIEKNKTKNYKFRFKSQK